MKKLQVSLLSLLVIGSLSFGATKTTKTTATKATTLEQSLDNLDKQLQELERREEAKYNTLKANAERAEVKISEYNDMYDKVSQKIDIIESNKSSFGSEIKKTLSEYKKIRSDIEKGIVEQQKIVDAYNEAALLRGE